DTEINRQDLGLMASYDGQVQLLEMKLPGPVWQQGQTMTKLAERHDAEVNVSLVDLIEPFQKSLVRARTTWLTDGVSVEQIAQRSMSRGGLGSRVRSTPSRFIA